MREKGYYNTCEDYYDGSSSIPAAAGLLQEIEMPGAMKRMKNGKKMMRGGGSVRKKVMLRGGGMVAKKKRPASVAADGSSQRDKLIWQHLTLEISILMFRTS